MKPEFIIQQQGKDYVLYAGLLDAAHEKGLKGITTTLVQIPSELNGMVAICHASAAMPDGTFCGIGDASPSNVSRMLVPHIIRMAETRAKARALRDATNIGVTAFEELGGDDAPAPNTTPTRRPSVAVLAGAKVDADAGHWPQNGGPVPNVDDLSRLPATDRQREALHKFGLREIPEGLTRARASEMISDYIAKKQA